MDKLLALRTKLLAVVKKAAWLGPLLARLAVGVTFAVTGWGKLHDLDKVTGFFTELHIPMPHLNAIVVGCTEFFGGLALILGLGARLASIPLAISMVVAILTAKLGDAHSVADVLGFDETLYVAIFVWILVAGPGAASVDALLARRLGRKAPGA